MAQTRVSASINKTTLTQVSNDVARRENMRQIFNINFTDELALRQKAKSLLPSPLLSDAQNLDQYMGQHEIPNNISRLAQRCSHISLNDWEKEAIRYSLRHGFLSQRENADNPASYIRIDCFGMQQQSPCVLEIWPGGHYSPIHEHAGCSGLVIGLVGRLDIMLYEHLHQHSDALGLVTLTEGKISWLSEQYGKNFYQVHQVLCPMPEDDFAASFHIYTNWQRETFGYCGDQAGKGSEKLDQQEFVTVSHYNWAELRQQLAKETPMYC